MMKTTSEATPARICSALHCTSRNDHSSAAAAMPSGWLRPSSAMPMPAKPSPAWKVVP